MPRFNEVHTDHFLCDRRNTISLEYRFMNIDVKETFSRFDDYSWLDRLFDEEPIDKSEICWDYIIRDIDSIERAITKTRDEEAVKLYLRYRIFWYPINEFIIHYIQNINGSINENNIQISKENILINNTTLKLSNIYQFRYSIQELS